MSDFLGARLLQRESPRKAARTSAPPSRTDRPRRGSPVPSVASVRALDWFVFFLADVQTGFGAFVSVYLAAQKWTQTDIGLVLTVGAFVGLVGQIPGGAIVDAARSERGVAAVTVAAVRFSAFALAVSPIFVVMFASRILQAGASCVLGPAIAAISLGLVGQRLISAPGPQCGVCFRRLRPRRSGHGASAYYVSGASRATMHPAGLIPAGPLSVRSQTSVRKEHLQSR